MDIKFGELPTARRGREESPRNIEIAAALKERPNEWAIVGENEKNDGLAARIRGGKAPSFRDGVFEARSRANEDGSYNIWARFVQEEPPKKAKK